MDAEDEQPEQLCKLFVGGLDYKTTEDGLKAHFSQWGEIVDCIVMKVPHTGQSRGFGFVTYKNSAMLEKAYAYRPHVLDGRDIDPKRAVPKESTEEPERLRKLFIGGLDFSTTEQTLKAHFEKFGEVVNCVIKRDPGTRTPRGFGFVVYKHSHMVDAAQAARPHKIDGFDVECKRPFPKEDACRPEVLLAVKKIYLGGIKEDDTEERLHEYFSQYGRVVSVNIVVDRYSGHRRGFAFVEFDDSDTVDKIVLRKHTIGGRPREVRKALSKAEMNNIRKQEMDVRGNPTGYLSGYSNYSGGYNNPSPLRNIQEYGSRGYYQAPFRGNGVGRSNDFNGRALRAARGGFPIRGQGPYGGGFGNGRSYDSSSGYRQ